MLRLHLTNPVPAHLAHHQPFPQLRPEYPLKPRVETKTGRRFQVISLPQKDGSFVASVLEAPAIRVYNHPAKRPKRRLRRSLKTPDLCSFERHPLAFSKDLTIDMEYDPDAGAFVTYVKELHRMSSFGETETTALDNTVEMIRGYIKSMEANRNKIPLAASKLANLKRLVSLG